jgi:hypothetical protein
MDNFINFICWLLFFVLIALEYSPYISTKNIFKKLSILGMAIAVLGFSQTYKDYEKANMCIMIFLVSALACFITCPIRTYWLAIKNKNTRRATD